VPKIALENTTVRSLPVPNEGTVDYWDAKLPAFGCRVSQGGTKTFVLKMHNTRKAIGRYPIVSLADAREVARRMLAEKTLGKVRPQSVSFEQALTMFLEEKSKARRVRTVSGYKRLMGTHFAFQGQLAAVSYDDFRRKLDRITAPSERNHALAAAKTFFTWAAKHRYITENPTIAFSLHGRPSRSRVLSDDELKKVWKSAEEIGGSFGAIVRLLILTGQRRGEIAALQMSWLGNDTITLPVEITKNRREHTFPIGKTAMAILTTLLPTKPQDKKAFLFPARGNPNASFSGWSKSKDMIDEVSGVQEWTLHDIRRTVATNLAALGVALPVVERLLNHVSGSFGGIVSVYQKHSFMPEMRTALEKWEARLLELNVY
jgi:integrase